MSVPPVVQELQMAGTRGCDLHILLLTDLLGGRPRSFCMTGHRVAYRSGRFTVTGCHYKISNITRITVPHDAEPIREEQGKHHGCFAGNSDHAPSLRRSFLQENADRRPV